MKNLFKLLIGIAFLPYIALATSSDGFPASVESMTDTSVTLTTTRAAQSGEYYSASCSPYTGKEEYDGFTVHTSITVPNLTKGVQYTCRMYIYPSSSGGQTQGMSQDVVFTAGDINSVISVEPENQPPTISNVISSFANTTAQVGVQTTWTATASDPDADQIKYKFWVCKLDGTMCSNAMNTSKEEWSTSNKFYWTPQQTGNYKIKTIVIDGQHQSESYPDGDDNYEVGFTVYDASTAVTESTTDTPAAGADTTPPAGYEDEVLTTFNDNPFPDTSISDLSGKAAAELYRRAVIGGYPDGEFKGSRSVNRAEAAKFLLLSRFGSVSDTSNSGQFWDVLDAQWYTKFVITAANKGIINGHPDGSFKPADTVNTAEFLKMLTKTFNLQENLSHSYSDVPSSAWYARYAGTAKKYNLFPSRSSKLLPSMELTREEVAIAIYQYLSNR